MQLVFSLPQNDSRKTLNQKLVMRRSIAKWFWENTPPNALAMDVPTRPLSLKVDMAALWTSTTRMQQSRSSIYTPVKTAVVICCLSREDCWPECSDAETILREITELKAKLALQEEDIRAKEPELRTSDMLFDEFASWDYSKSTCKAYHQNRHRLANLETALFKGTRLARIDASQCGNLHYLAVPEGTIAPHELIEKWGLFTVNLENETATLAIQPTTQDTTMSMQNHLVQSMLISSTRQVNDMLGLKFNDDESVSLVRPPSIHHKPSTN